jgi:hypothetical protein
MGNIISFDKEATVDAVFHVHFDNGKRLLVYRDEETCGLYLAPVLEGEQLHSFTVDEDDEILLCYDNDGFVYNRIKKLINESQQ